MPLYRVVSKGANEEYVTREFRDVNELCKAYVKIGVEEDSYSLRLHNEPILKGLVGPLSDEVRGIVRYESPQVYAEQTEIWSKRKRARRRSAR